MTAPAPTRGGEREDPGFNRWWWASAIVVAAIGGMLAWLVLFPGGPATPAPAPAPAAAPPASACGLTGSGPATPPATTPTPPPGFTWRLVGTMAAPGDPANGPGATTGGLGSCYAPTPLGALYAAYGFVAATSTPTLRTAALTTLCAPGAGRDTALADLATGDTGGQATGIQLAGFRFLEPYTPAGAATIDLAATTGRGGYAHFTLGLVWSHGTWLVHLPVTGSPYDTAATVPGLAGYAPWAGA